MEPLGDHHALIDDGAGGEARNIEGRVILGLGVADGLVRLLADDIELALERGAIGRIVSPKAPGSTGTSRQPRKYCPSAPTRRSIVASHWRRVASFRGRN